MVRSYWETPRDNERHQRTKGNSKETVGDRLLETTGDIMGLLGRELKELQR